MNVIAEYFLEAFISLNNFICGLFGIENEIVHNGGTYLEDIISWISIILGIE